MAIQAYLREVEHTERQTAVSQTDRQTECINTFNYVGKY